MKTITIESSKYTINYNPDKVWEYQIYRFEENVSNKLRTNILDDIVFYLIENLEKGVKLEGIMLICLITKTELIKFPHYSPV